jgi:hypothetical protein
MKNSVVDKLKQYGILIAPLLAVKVFVRKIFKISWKSSYLMHRQLSDYDEEFPDDSVDDNTQIKKLTFDDLYNGYCKEYFDNEKLEIFKNRLGNPLMEGYGLFANGDLACYEWINYEKLEITSTLSLPLPPGSALLCDGFCHPDYRKRGYHKIINMYQIKKIYEKNIKNVFVIVLKYNKPAVAAQSKCGLKIIQSFISFKIGKKEYSTLKPVDMKNLG